MRDRSQVTEPTAREAALQVLAQWQEVGNPPRVPDRDDLLWQHMEPRQRATAFDLLQGVLRSRGLLDHVIEQLLDKPIGGLEHVVRAALELGAYQALLQSNVTDYSLVDSSVELVRLAGKPRAAGLVNAILRGLLRLEPRAEPFVALRDDAFPVGVGRQVRFNRRMFPSPQGDVAGHLAVVCSYPKPLVQMLLQAYGPVVTLRILIAGNLRPVVLLRDDGANTQDLGGLVQHQQKGWLAATDGWTLAVAGQVAAGKLSPQDPTAGLAVESLCAAIKAVPPDGAPRPLALLDLCAGKGTKTIQLAMRRAGDIVVATDIAPLKLELLRGRARQLGLHRVRINLLEEVLIDHHAFDAVLVDVPCSNTGVMARRVQTRWRWPKLDRKVLQRQQLMLLTQAQKLLRAGGILVYSTCSIDPCENGDLVRQWLELQQRSPWRIVHEQMSLPAATDDPAERCDGGYVCVLAAAGQLAV
ncbi:MAG: hypothetical protein HKL96_11435 [Phycisphaerales bacterium]|nr:hypothetical protein [Phycisphaerales bacterium]